MSTNKNDAFRQLICLSISFLLLFGSICGAYAEPNKNKVTVSMDLKLKKNYFFARYGLTVYVDGQKVDSLPNGGRMIRILKMSLGKHAITLCANKSNVPDMSFDIFVTDNMSLTASLQTHRKYISVNHMILKTPDNTIEYDDTSSTWLDFLTLLNYSLMYERQIETAIR